MNNSYSKVRVSQIGLADPTGVEGVLVLTSEDGRSVTMSSFSGEVAAMISNFTNGDRVSIPTIYKLIEDLEDRMGIMLVRVEIYNSKENVMRSDLFFVDRNNKQVKLEGYKASDAIALAAYHDVEIFVEDKLLARASA